jgi:hypothetical protein
MHDEQRADAVRDAAVALLMEARAEYLANGANPLKHWDQLQDRLAAAMRTSGSAEQLVSTLRRGLNLSAPSSAFSNAATVLVGAMDADPMLWIGLLESELGYLMARARVEAERRKAAREEAK